MAKLVSLSDNYGAQFYKDVNNKIWKLDKHFVELRFPSVNQADIKKIVYSKIKNSIFLFDNTKLYQMNSYLTLVILNLNL